MHALPTASRDDVRARGIAVRHLHPGVHALPTTCRDDVRARGATRTSSFPGFHARWAASTSDVRARYCDIGGSPGVHARRAASLDDVRAKATTRLASPSRWGSIAVRPNRGPASASAQARQKQPPGLVRRGEVGWGSPPSLPLRPAAAAAAPWPGARGGSARGGSRRSQSARGAGDPSSTPGGPTSCDPRAPRGGSEAPFRRKFDPPPAPASTVRRCSLVRAVAGGGSAPFGHRRPRAAARIR